MPEELLYEDRCQECGAVAEVRVIMGQKMCAGCAQLFDEEFVASQAVR
jgi:hypothetical protein